MSPTCCQCCVLSPKFGSAVSNVRVVLDRVLRAGGWSAAAAVVLLIPSAFISLDSRFKGEGFAASVLMVALIGGVGEADTVGVGWCTLGECAPDGCTLGDCTLGDCTLGDCTLGDCSPGCCCGAVVRNNWTGWSHSAAVSFCVAMSRKTSLSACSPWSFCWLFQFGD